MTRVRVVRLFMHDGKRRLPGEVLELSPAYAKALVIDRTVELVELPARGYSHRMMTAMHDNTRA